MTRRLVAPLTVAVLLVVLAAPARLAAAAGSSATVTLTDSASPDSVNLPAGGNITFVNRDGERHRLRVREPEDVDTGNLEPGERATLRLRASGTYRFVDERTDDTAYTVTVYVSGAVGADDAAPSSGDDTGDGTGGGSGSSSPSGSTAPKTATVTIPSRSFSPASVTIAAGGTVTWENRDGDHTVTARDRGFDSGILDEGGTYRRTFTTPGSYAYFCLLHPEMTGSVEVVGAAGGAPDANTPRPTADANEAPTFSATGGGADNAHPAAARPPGNGAPAERSLDIVDFGFEPASIDVPVGTTLTWVNRGEAPHTVTSTGQGPLGSDVLDPGGTYRWVAEKPGTYAYFCALHPEMVGEVVVTAAGRSTSAADAAGRPGSGSDGTAGIAVDSRNGAVTEVTGEVLPAGADGGDDLPIIAGMLLAVMTVTFVIARGTARR